MEEEGDSRVLCKIVDSLSGEQRRCIIAFYYNLMSVEEIARAYRMPEKEVEIHLESANQKLYKLQKEQEKSFSFQTLAAELFLAFGEEAQEAVMVERIPAIPAPGILPS